MLTSPLRFSQHYGLAGLLRLNPTRFHQEGEIATQESASLFSLSLTLVVRDLPAPVHFLLLRRWVSTCRWRKAHPLNEPVCLIRITLRLCLTSPSQLLPRLWGRVVLIRLYPQLTNSSVASPIILTTSAVSWTILLVDSMITLVP